MLFLSPEDLGVELSDDLSAVNADSDGADTEQGEDEDEVDDVLSPVVAEDSEESFTELGLQKGTFVIDELDEGDNELGRPRVEHISGERCCGILKNKSPTVLYPGWVKPAFRAFGLISGTFLGFCATKHGQENFKVDV